MKKLRLIIFKYGHILILLLWINYVLIKKDNLQINPKVARMVLIILLIIYYINIINYSVYFAAETTKIGELVKTIRSMLLKNNIVRKFYVIILNIGDFFIVHLNTFRVLWTWLLYIVLLDCSFSEGAAGVIIIIIWIVCWNRNVHIFLSGITRLMLCACNNVNTMTSNETEINNKTNDNFQSNDNESIIKEKRNAEIKNKQIKEQENIIRDLGYTSKELCVYRGPFDSSSKNLALVDSKHNGSVLRGGTDILNPKVTVDDIRKGRIQIKMNSKIIDKNQKFNIYTTDGLKLIFKGTI